MTHDRPKDEERGADGGRRGPWRRHDGTGPWTHHERRWSGMGEPGWSGPDGRRPPRFMRRLGCLFGVFFLLVLVGVASSIGLVASWLGLLGAQPGSGPGPVAQGLVVILVVAVVFGVWRLGRGLRGLAGPIDDLVSAARRIEQGDLDARVAQPGTRSGELRDLVTAFNTMAERLQVDERQRRSLLADVSHELRTPLAIVRGNLEAMQDGVHPTDPAHLQSVIDETAVLARLIDDLRTVALAEAGTLALHVEPTDLSILAQETADAHRHSATTAGVTLRVAAGDTPLLDVDPVRIREVVSNLVANAIRYTPSGGSVSIEVASEGPGARLVVSDTGAGIDPALLPQIFDRFWKTPGSPGSGLGLAIVRNLVERHGGSVEAASALGSGTSMSVHLPGPAAASQRDRGHL